MPGFSIRSLNTVKLRICIRGSNACAKTLFPENMLIPQWKKKKKVESTN